jgi:hypothetical protein
MKAVRPQGRAGGEHQRAGNIHAPKAVPTLGLGEKHYLAWGNLRLALGVAQMAVAAAAILCLILVGLSSATLTCAAVATTSTMVSRTLFHGRRGVRR